MNDQKNLSMIIDELRIVLQKINSRQVELIVKEILEADRIFFAGAGRTGLMIRAFAMRLMHMGLKTYIVGDTTTPSIVKGDLLFIGSGSGETASLVSMIRKTTEKGIRNALITIFSDSTIGRMSESVLEIPAPTPKSLKKTDAKSIQPMGSLFEQSLLLLLDSLVLLVMERKGINSDMMFGTHANLE